MGSNVVPGYNPILFGADETTLGTPVAPADVATFAAQAISTIDADMGDAQAPETRGKQDRGLTRDMQDGFVSGRYTAPAWSVVTSLRSRADADDAPRELALWKAAGFGRTVNSGVSYVLAPTNTPVESSDFVPQTFTRILGRAPGEMEMERLFGVFCEKVRIEGGDKEVTATFSGKAQAKAVGTALSSITVTDVASTITVTAAESRAFAPGYYVCESEVILVGPVTYGGTTINITRAQLGTSAAAHAAKPIYPYIPSGISYGGAPISEALTTSFVLDSESFRVLNWSVDLTTGLQALPGETGSAYPFQGLKSTRVDVAVSLNFILKGDDVRKFNKATSRTDMAVSIVQGTSAGGIVTLAFGHCELVAPKAKDNANDTISVQASLRVRGSGGTTPDSFSITFT